MGDIDLVKVVLDRIGEMRWMQIAIRPAKPFAFGVVGEGTPVFGLPGNPVSSMVSYELLARPALRRMAGHPDGRWHRPPAAAVAAEAMARRPDGKLHLARVVGERDDDGVLRVRSAGGQGSHHLTAMARAPRPGAAARRRRGGRRRSRPGPAPRRGLTPGWGQRAHAARSLAG